MSDNKLFSFQGPVFLGERGSSGKPINLQWVGDATMTVEMSTESVEHNESFSGQRMVYGRLATKKSATATLTLFEATLDNLATALYAKRAEKTGGSVTGEILPPDLAAGHIVALDNSFVTNLVINAASGGALQEGVHYILENPEGGHVKILDVGSHTQPFTAAYEYESVTNLGIFSETPPERWVRMVATNTLNNETTVIDLFRVRFDPASQLPLHNEEFGSFELSGSALVDSQLANESELGGFGRLTIQKG